MYQLIYDRNGKYITNEENAYIKYVLQKNTAYIQIKDQKYFVKEITQLNNIKTLFENGNIDNISTRDTIKTEFYMGLDTRTFEKFVLISDLENKDFELNKEYYCLYYLDNKYLKYKKIKFLNKNGIVNIKYKNTEVLYPLNKINFEISYFLKEKNKIIYKML